MEPRLVAGLLLVAGSVAVGGRLFSVAGGSYQLVLTARHQLVPGERIGAADLSTARVQLKNLAGRYLSAGSAAAGYVVIRAVGAGDLIPAAALAQPGQVAATQVVDVPVPDGHAPPDLTAGQQVDVYVTDRTPDGGGNGQVSLVVPAAAVQSVSGGDALSAGGTGLDVELSVPATVVPKLIHAVENGEIDLTTVPAS
jgi:hypothetical protein